MSATAKMRHCFNCGAEIGIHAQHDPLDTCGAHECEREARNCEQQERDDAHHEIDRNMGWF
jgi:hypothetical protein